MRQGDPLNRGYYLEQAVVKDNHFITAIGSAFIEIADYPGLTENKEKKVQLAKIYKNIV